MREWYLTLFLVALLLLELSWPQFVLVKTEVLDPEAMMLEATGASDVHRSFALRTPPPPDVSHRSIDGRMALDPQGSSTKATSSAQYPAFNFFDFNTGSVIDRSTRTSNAQRSKD